MLATVAEDATLDGKININRAHAHTPHSHTPDSIEGGTRDKTFQRVSSYLNKPVHCTSLLVILEIQIVWAVRMPTGLLGHKHRGRGAKEGRRRHGFDDTRYPCHQGWTKGQIYVVINQSRSGSRSSINWFCVGVGKPNVWRFVSLFRSHSHGMCVFWNLFWFAWFAYSIPFPYARARKTRT